VSSRLQDRASGSGAGPSEVPYVDNHGVSNDPTPPRFRAGGSAHGEFAEFGPAVHLRVDDVRGAREVLRELSLRLLEVSGVHVGCAGVVVLEGLDQHVGAGVRQGARPFVEQAALFGAGGLGEGAGDLGPGVGVLGLDRELGGDEDQGSLLQ